MKSWLLAAMVLSILALANAAATPGEYSDIAAMLRQYELSSNKNPATKEEDMENEYPDVGGDDDDDDDDAVIQVVKNVLLSSIMQDEDGRGDENDAMANGFFKKIFRKLKKSRLGKMLGGVIKSRLRSRLCGRRGK